jgi:peroxidase
MKPEPSVKVKIRETFEEFTSDPNALSALKRLYKSPDEVDLVVGIQLLVFCIPLWKPSLMIYVQR